MIKPGMYISERYEIIEKVGSGGMADVYKAKCHRLNRYVAIKILKPEYSSDKNFVTKFRGEAQSAAGLSHPNIVNVYDVGEDDGLYYIVMELVEGITLKKFIERKGKLEIKEAVGIAIQIAQGMEAAHANHIIHRDIKPQNIIISRDGKVKVTDFGIAKAATSNTVTQNAIGSVHYLSPEQARGGYSDEKSDIYSLGVTLYEMLSGKVPFAGDNTVSVALLHIQGEAVPVRELNPDVPPSVDKIVQKCMQKKPERRYLTAAELIHDLKRSITNPDGDFVKLTSGIVTDSPTIHLTDDEMHHIKNATKTAAADYEPPVKEDSKKVANEDDEDLDSVDTKLEKVLTIGSIVMIGVIAVVIIVVVGKFMGFFGGGSSKEEVTPTPIVTVTPTPEITEEVEADKVVVKVPSVVGLSYDDAVKSLRAVSEYFNITTVEEYSSEYEAGYVIKQEPVSESDIVSNSDVKLFVSIGAETTEVPNVYGLSVDQAIQTLEAQGFVVADPIYQSNEEVAANMVIKTDPENGTMSKKGNKITLYVSEGPAVTSVEVPLLIGLTQAAAEERLAEKGLILGKVSPVSSTQYATGTVSYQSTTAGQSVPKGTTIDISISTGPDNATASPTPVPPTPTETIQPTATPTPIPTEESTETSGSVTRYVGKVTITYNPFAEGESGEIYLELTQDGEAMEIMTKTLSYSDFPYTVSFEGIKEGSGIVTMYINGTPYTEQSWSVNLTAEKN